MEKLLIIEDDMLLDEAYRKKFANLYETKLATNGEDGIKEVRSWKPDVILLDIYLPGGASGLDVLSELKKKTETASIPVLVITNLPDAVERVMAMGAAKCFMKVDVDLDQIEKSLEEILAKSAK